MSQRGHGAAFDKAKARPQHGHRGLRILVKACRQTHRIGQGQRPDLGGEHGIIAGHLLRTQACGQRADSEVVGVLRIEQMKRLGP